LPELTLEVRLPQRFGNVSAFSPCHGVEASLSVDSNVHRVTLRDVPLYSVILLERQAAHNP
jgi:hypothetical protein